MHEDCCCGSNCHNHGHVHRKVLTRAERVEKLKNYAEELKKELSAVEEHIKQLNE